MSLRLRLLLIIGMSLTVLWGAVASWMFMDTRQSLRDALDNRLASSARMVAGLVAQFPRSQLLTHGGNSSAFDVIARDGIACEVSLLRSEVTVDVVARTAGSPDLTRLDTGFGTHIYGDQRWRTYVLRQGNIQVATADRIDLREALVKELIWSAGLPFVVALLGSLILLWFGITHGLAPLERIRALLARRRPGDDSPLPAVKAPAELRPLLRTVEQLLDRVQAAIVRERRFTDSAAHELRTPLTGVKTHVQVARLAAQRPGESETLESALIGAERGALQLQGILERLLELARLDDQPAHAETSDAADAVGAAIEALRPLHGDVDGRVSVSGADHAPVGVARPLLVSALQNVLDNALRYTPPTAPIVVNIGRQDDGMVRISVFDEGPGLNPRERALAVNRFWRGATQLPGNGLGLSIVDAIARRYGGSLVLLERDGPGLEARLLLPAAAPPY